MRLRPLPRALDKLHPVAQRQFEPYFGKDPLSHRQTRRLLQRDNK